MYIVKWISVIFISLVIIGVALQWFVERGLMDLDDLAREKAPGKFARLENGVTHYAWHGPESGKTVLLVHGLTTPSFVWAGILDDLTGAGFRVLTYDIYGRGWSDRPATEYSAKLYNQQILDLLTDQKISGPVNIVGYSMGGAVVTHFNANHGNRVSKIALIAPAGFLIDVGALGKLVQMPIIGDWLMAVVGKQNMISEMSKPENQGKAVPDIVQRYEVQMSYKGYLQAILSTLRYFPLGEMKKEFEIMGKSGKPVLALWGSLDTVVPTENSRLLAIAVPQADIHILPGITHAITYSAPEQVGPLLAKFFK